MIRRDALSEHLRGSLWALPGLGALVAVALGSVLSLVDTGPGFPLVFQGTADDARNLLIGITSTMVTVIALLLGLAVVALQLSSTQFSPRLLRNFLRDRPNQLVLSVFVGTFTYSAAGLFTVGVSGGTRTTEFPRLAVTVALVLLFVSLALLVYFADHLAHSIQVDRIMRVAQHNVLSVLRQSRLEEQGTAPPVPPWAVPVPARCSGYVQAVDGGRLLARAAASGLACVRLRPWVGEHVVAGTTLLWAWTPSPEGTVTGDIDRELAAAVRIGFERTLEQDLGLGIRQLVDIACKALSPAVNDPYTAIQAIDHLSVIFSRLAAEPMGDRVVHDAHGRTTVAVPQRRFVDYLELSCGLIRRSGDREPTVIQSLLRLLATCGALAREEPERWAAIERQADILVSAAEQAAMPADLHPVYRQAETVRNTLAARRSRSVAP